MKDGFIRTAAASPRLRVADPEYNSDEIIRLSKEAAERGVKLLVFPELAITAYTCGDLFFQETLLKKAAECLKKTAAATKDLDMLIFVGFPFSENGKLYNTAAVLKGGELLALIPKINIPQYVEFYEGRYFKRGKAKPVDVPVEGFGEKKVPFGTDIIFRCPELPGFAVAAEICEDVWVPFSPSNKHAAAGATIIANLSASDETAGKADFRRELIASQSSRLICSYIYACAGPSESTTDLVFGAHRIIAEDGIILEESKLYHEGLSIADTDVQKLSSERRRKNTFPSLADSEEEELLSLYRNINISFDLMENSSADAELCRFIDPQPFVPHDSAGREDRCREILNIQSYGLKKRLEHTGSKRAVIGISGGLDSTLALLVTKRAFDILGYPSKDIICVTMPAFGTTDRTYSNACKMVKSIGASLREINIKEAVNLHFRDISHDSSVHNAAYENSQARERTQILMDIANDENALVIGTGDLSELALGWCTYNGDHMSMYAVNADVPKTLVRYLVKYYADTEAGNELSAVLTDVLDTPVSPELLPPEETGEISQKTEDLVGPYELHDFFLFNMVRYGFPPKKIMRLAERAFSGVYDRETILKWLKTFYRRFFSQQFKRSCMPDGPKVGSVDLSPRGGFRMPSDAVNAAWLSELSEL